MSNATTASDRGDHSDGFWRKVTLFALVSLLMAGLWWVWRGGLNGDEGFYLLSSVRVIDGLHPWRGFGFTQTPLLAYANVGWLRIFGFDLLGIRLASLSWFVGAVGLGVGVLQRRHGWAAAASFVILLACAPVTLDFMAKGKTYALAALAVLGGQLVLMGADRSRGAWTWFLLAAAVGVSTRLPAMAFFGPAWVVMLIGTPTWRARGEGIVTSVLAAVAVLAVWAGPDLASAWWWAVEFHQESQLQGHVGRSWARFLALAPGVWFAMIGAVWFGGRSGGGRDFLLGWAVLAVAISANILPVNAYAEYLTILVPAIAAGAAPALGRFMASGSKLRFGGIVVGLVGLGWGQAPVQEPTLLRDAAVASAFVAANTSADAVVVTSMPEIAVAANRQVPVELTLGKFGLTEELSDELAGRYGMATPARLAALMTDDATEALVFSIGAGWNFAWSLPSLRRISGDGLTAIREVIDRDYTLAYSNATYVVFLRNR